MTTEPLSADRLDPFWELVHELLVIYDETGRILRANAAWAYELGLGRLELEGHELLEFVDPGDHPLAVELLDAELVGLRRRPLELRMHGPAGARRVFEWSAVHDPGTRQFHGAARDVTETIRATRALRQVEERYRELFTAHPVAMVVWDQAAREILAVNDAAVRQYGYARDELVGMTVDRITHSDDISRLFASTPRPSAGVDGGTPIRHVRRDGSVIEVLVAGQSLDFEGRQARLVMAIDVTERRSLEARLVQAQKMEAVGRLAGGIAHDFNNLLTAILGYGRMLADSLDTDDPRHADAMQILGAGERAAELTGQLLALSRADMVQPTTFDLNAAVREVVPTLSELMPTRVQLELALAAGAAWIRGDRGRIGELVVDLATNAVEAMPSGGRLRIATVDAGPDELLAEGLGSSASVVLTIADTGHGIAPEIGDRIVEPFFTTKAPGRRTGLGLATAYATVRQAGGQIRIDSEPGAGTTIRIAIPVTGAPEVEPSTSPISSSGRPPRATILLAEDEPAVRELLGRQLRAAGYEVVAAADGAAALDKATSVPIDLLLSDIVMPGLSGRDLARELRARMPSLPVLLMSGYTDEGATDSDGEPLALLIKPFPADVLLDRISGALAEVGRDQSGLPPYSA